MRQDNSIEVAKTFATVGRELIEQPDAERLHHRTVEVAAKIIGCPGTALLRISKDGSVSGLAYHGPAYVDADRLITTVTGQGPALQAARDQKTVLADDLSIETRWPNYTVKLLASTTVRSVLALPLHVAGHNGGLLVFYADQAEYFGDTLCDLASVFADHVATALAYHAACDRAQHLDVALTTNREIGSAMGILMERHGIGDTEAFDVLRRRSQDLNIKLRTVAQSLITSRLLPPGPGKPDPSVTILLGSTPEHRSAISAMSAAGAPSARKAS
jgi:transcriptional regulator with GAF, ATPase, and Fis domain